MTTEFIIGTLTFIVWWKLKWIMNSKETIILCVAYYSVPEFVKLCLNL